MERARGRNRPVWEPGPVDRARWMLMHLMRTLDEALGGEGGERAELIGYAAQSAESADAFLAKAQRAEGGGGGRG